MATEVESTPVAEEAAPAEVEPSKPEENHVEENKPTEETQSAEKIEDAVEGEKKEENGSLPPKVILHQHPPGPTIPGFLPNSLKLETYLRMVKIPYENFYESKLGSSKEKVPFIEYQGDKVQDTNFCIKYLNKKFNVDPDAHLSAEQKAMCHAIQAMAEENTYWSLAYYRWVDNYQETKKYYSNLAPVYKDLRPKLDQNKCIKCMQAHGIGKHTKEEIYAIAEEDLRAMSALLGEKEFFMDSEPCTLDCTMFGLLACFVYGTEESPQNKLIREELKNLADFCDRMKLNYWLDWGDICSEEHFEEFKPKSRLSFKKKGKRTKSNADQKEGEEGEKEEGEKKEEEVKEEGAEKKEGDDAENAESPAEDGAKPAEEGEGGKSEEAKPTEDEAKDTPAAEEKPAEPEQ
ncbi:failed axon connections homolog isoform X2 [Nematostella vectensis]|nr:failed axon connections homolog isoform X2 [Nematostella vectensis]